MNCEQAHQFIHALLDDEIAPADRSNLDGHVHSCEPCRALLAQYREIQSGFGWLAEQNTEVILPKADGVSRSSLARRRIRFPLWRWAGGAIAAAAAVAALFYYLGGEDSPGRSKMVMNAPLTIDAPPTAFAPPVEVELVGESANRFLALPQSTDNPRVHIVWLYATQPQAKPSSERPAASDKPLHS